MLFIKHINSSFIIGKFALTNQKRPHASRWPLSFVLKNLSKIETFNKKSPAAKRWRRRSTGQCHSGGKQVICLPIYILPIFSVLHRIVPHFLRQENSHQGSNPGGNIFNFLDVSINKKPVFFSYVVTCKKKLV
jgi:hypothetical protein